MQCGCPDSGQLHLAAGAKPPLTPTLQPPPQSLQSADHSLDLQLSSTKKRIKLCVTDPGIDQGFC